MNYIVNILVKQWVKSITDLSGSVLVRIAFG